MSVGFLPRLWGWALTLVGSSASEEDLLLARYERAVDAMPADTRIIFILHRVQELNYRAIADTRGISVADVEKHLIDALRIVAAHVPDPLD